MNVGVLFMKNALEMHSKCVDKNEVSCGQNSNDRDVPIRTVYVAPIKPQVSIVAKKNLSIALLLPLC